MAYGSVAGGLAKGVSAGTNRFSDALAQMMAMKQQEAQMAQQNQFRERSLGMQEQGLAQRATEAEAAATHRANVLSASEGARADTNSFRNLVVHDGRDRFRPKCCCISYNNNFAPNPCNCTVWRSFETFKQKQRSPNLSHRKRFTIRII